MRVATRFLVDLGELLDVYILLFKNLLVGQCILLFEFLGSSGVLQRSPFSSLIFVSSLLLTLSSFISHYFYTQVFCAHKLLFFFLICLNTRACRLKQ